MADINNKNIDANISNNYSLDNTGDVAESAELDSAVAAEVSEAENAYNLDAFFSQPQSSTGEHMIYADLVKNQLVTDTGGHTVISSAASSPAPNAAETQATANQANESRLLEDNLKKESQHAAEHREAEAELV